MRTTSEYQAPRAEVVLRAALATAQATSGTLSTVVDILTDRRTRAARVAASGDPAIQRAWAWFEELPETIQAAVAAPLRWRIEGLLSRPGIREFLDGPSTIDLSEVLDHQVLLLRAAKGTIGTDGARVVSSLVVAMTWMAALGRVSQPEAARRLAFLVVDEFQNALGLPDELGSVLAEARAMRLGVCLAHTHLAQIPREVREAVAANCLTKLLFACSEADGSALARYVEPELSASDLVHLPPHRIAVRMTVHGQVLPAFVLQTLPLPPPIQGRAEAVRAASAEQFAPSAAERRRQALRRQLGPQTGPGNSYDRWGGSGPGQLDMPTSQTPNYQRRGAATPANETSDWTR
jgi:hypothetical protein